MKSRTILFAALFIAGAFKTCLSLTAAVPFNSDEAVVALMARHILEGARPVFFYGQSYMGSLDAILIAGGFAALGEAIWVIRLVQTLLYLGFMFTTWLLARRLFRDPRIADVAVLLLAVPTVLVSTYTTATLGGYGEVLVLGNLVLLLGYEVTFGRYQENIYAWAGLGLAAGLGFWTLGLIGIYLLPVGILGLLRLRTKQFPYILAAAAGFFAGGLPWWLYNFGHDWSAMSVLLGNSEFRLPAATLGLRLFGMVFLGLPALIGMRFPWLPDYAPVWILLPVLVFILSAGLFYLRARKENPPPLRKGAGWLLALMVIGFVVIFSVTYFGIDSTGRYFLPLYIPFIFGLAGAAVWLYRERRAAAWAFVALVLLINAVETLRAAALPDRLTTQFDPISSFDNASDQELMQFLRSEGETRGYTNYWVTFRLAFLSQEELVFSPRLPYKADFSYTDKDNRYPEYDEAVSRSSRLAFITTRHPELDERLRQDFERLGVGYAEKQIGAYHIFYGLTRPVRPAELSLAP